MDNPGFEEAIDRIEEIVNTLSEEHIELLDALELFKEATELIVLCNKTLKNAELTVEEYKKKLIPEETI